MVDTKEKIIHAAHTLVINQGWTSTGIQQICRQAEVSKGAFFHYFKNKNSLAEALISYAGSQILDSFAVMNDTSKPAKKRLFSLLDQMLQYAKNPENSRGCVIGIIGQEQIIPNLKLQHLTASIFKQAEHYFNQLYVEIIAQSSGNHSTDVFQLGSLWVTILQGSLLMNRATGTQIIY